MSGHFDLKNDQNNNEDKKKIFQETGLDEVGGVTPIQFEELKDGHLRVRHTYKDSDLVIHMFWEEPPPSGSPMSRYVGNGLPEQLVFAPWPKMFRELTFQALVRNYKLDSEPSRINIEWVAELASWCITVKGIASIIKPPSSIIENLVGEVLAAL